MRTYAQYCPIVRAVEVLGERWTLLIVREMLNGAGRFNELSRGLPGLSRALLSRRLRQLVAAGLVRRTDDGYELTEAGKDLRPLVFGLAEWGARHAFGDPRPEELDPEVLMWWLQGRVDSSEVDRRAVIQIQVTDRGRQFWLVVSPGTYRSATPIRASRSTRCCGRTWRRSTGCGKARSSCSTR